MWGSDGLKEANGDSGKAVAAREEAACAGQKFRKRRSWAVLLLVILFVSLLSSAASVAMYDRFFAQKVVTANIAGFVLDQRDLYFQGKIDREQYVANLNRLIVFIWPDTYHIRDGTTRARKAYAS